MVVECAQQPLRSLAPAPLALTPVLDLVFPRTLQTQGSVGRLAGARSLLRHSNLGMVTLLMILLLICSGLSSMPGNTWSPCITWRGLPFMPFHPSHLTPFSSTVQSASINLCGREKTFHTAGLSKNCKKGYFPTDELNFYLNLQFSLQCPTQTSQFWLKFR